LYFPGDTCIRGAKQARYNDSPVRSQNCNKQLKKENMELDDFIVASIAAIVGGGLAPY